MSDLSLPTLQIIAYSKILFAVTLTIVALLMRYRLHTPWVLSIVASVSISGLYLVLSWPLKTMWWGNNGDELFIVSFFSQVLFAQPFNDFFYHGLPQFYPPLYFWVVGFFAQPFAQNAITAAKIGGAATLLFWFAGTYCWQKIYYRFVSGEDGEPWVWLAAPLIFFFLLDFNDIILKPYETLPALAVALLVGMAAQTMVHARWTWRRYLFFGISGAVLFLTYYFWWFMAIPALVLLAWSSAQPRKNFLSIIGVGALMAAGASVYLVPLFLSYARGIENWQALFFVPQDFSTFLPFAILSWKTPLLLTGVISLVLYRAHPFIKAQGILLLCCYAYQLLNIIAFALGKNPLQSAKPFLFLGTATLAVGCSTLLRDLWKKYSMRLSAQQYAGAAGVFLILSLPYWPMTTFMDDPVVRSQIEKNLEQPSASYLAPAITHAVPDYRERTWLSSGIPEINAYLPLHYFLAYNPHFSHPAAQYSQRLALVRHLAQGSSDELASLISQAGIDALLLYKEKQNTTYPIFLWHDAYPNGGKEVRIDIPKISIDSLQWNKTYENSEWIIYTKPAAPSR